MLNSWESVQDTLNQGLELSVDQTHWAMAEILEGKASVDQIKGFLLGLKAKGETPGEISAMVDQMYQFAAPISIPDRSVDTVGTGGDGANTINISTTAAIITTAAGARVVKHGNRAASSMTGAADLLEELGVAIGLDGEAVARCVYKLGIGFCFAPKFHPAMRFAAPARKELGVPTVFNVLGPLANPAKPKVVAIGVASERNLPIMAQVLGNRGCEGFVFRGDDGLDEVTLTTTSTVIQISDGKLKYGSFDPQEIGIDRAPLSAIVGGDRKHNADVTRSILDGRHGPARDAVLLNAAVAIAAFKADFNLSIEQQIANGWVMANAAVDSGAAKKLLANWVKLSQELESEAASR